MPKYKPVLVSIDEVGYKDAVQQCENRLAIYNNALQMCEKWLGEQLIDHELFGASFTQYFKQRYRELNGKYDEFQWDALMNLLGIDYQELVRLENEFNSTTAPLQFNGRLEPPVANVDRKPFERWTKSSQENERLRDGKRLIECIEYVAKHTKVYPITIQQATSNFIRYDIRTQQYYVGFQQ